MNKPANMELTSAERTRGAEMELKIVYFTPGGKELAGRIKSLLLASEMCPVSGVELWDARRKDKDTMETAGGKITLREYVGEAFEKGNALLFVGAAGIAVRMIAPFVKDKLYDPPVLVADEKGKYVIPILSGHVGGANELAATISGLSGAECVTTTATDVNSLFSVDVFATRNDLAIKNREGIAKVSAALLRGEALTVSMEKVESVEEALQKGLPCQLEYVQFPPGEPVDILVTGRREKEALQLETKGIWLEPKEYVLGMGCKKNTGFDQLEAFAGEWCATLGVGRETFLALTSIDVKKEEPGLCELARAWQMDFITYPAGQLAALEGDYTPSAFVETAVGVDNVCERSVAAYLNGRGQLILRKTAAGGMTLAVGYLPWKLKTMET